MLRCTVSLLFRCHLVGLRVCFLWFRSSTASARTHVGRVIYQPVKFPRTPARALICLLICTSNGQQISCKSRATQPRATQLSCNKAPTCNSWVAAELRAISQGIRRPGRRVRCFCWRVVSSFIYLYVYIIYIISIYFSLSSFACIYLKAN